MWRILLSAVLLCPADPIFAGVCDAMLRGDASLGRDDATCSESVVLRGGAQMVCFWPHSYRSAEAEADFAALAALVERCLDTRALPGQGAQVNHPDSFGQRLYEGRGWRASVSLKDKGALGQSLVFLSLSRATP